MTITIRENVPLAPLTTFKIGGPARYFVEVRNEEQVREALAYAVQRGIPFVILAGGSNVLVPDEGIRALVIHCAGGEYRIENGMLSADAGVELFSLIRSMSRDGWGGWERLAGIPGTIGGAVRGNAGAFGSEIKDFIVDVSAFDAHRGNKSVFDSASCEFDYRRSFFKDNPRWIITSARFYLRRVDKTHSLRLIEETIVERERRHIQNVSAAGSFFINPMVPVEIQKEFEQEKDVSSKEGRVPAGWLIEKAGLKGARVGGAEASAMHPNYIINMGDATANDVLALAAQIKEAVRTQFGITLEEEAVIL